MSTIRFIALVTMISVSKFAMMGVGFGDDPEQLWQSGDEPREVIAQAVGTLMGYLSANAADIGQLWAGVTIQKQGERLDHTTLYNPTIKTRLWSKIDRSMCFMFDRYASVIAGSENDLNQRLKSWEVARMLETNWGIEITIQSFIMNGKTHFAVTYSMDITPVAALAINSFRVFGPARDGTYGLIDSAKQDDYLIVNEVLAKRRQSTSPNFLRAESLRLSLIGPCRMTGDMVGIKTTWIYPTGRGIIIDWFFDGKELIVDNTRVKTRTSSGQARIH